MSETVLQQIDKVVKENDIVLFMKGTPDFPQCGFSQRVAAIISSYDIPFAAVNVLLSEEVRQGIKDYSNWPTIPQLYISGEFIGGCDIVSEMQENGELAELLEPLKKEA
ncbi:monothiol glutaredoxin [Mariprofundus ferrinatatus]|uniref:Glutaredoxin n=1 Tax=Mariprofundus ferrinatatus TaxID=1921087 RepID=A0A2K8L125_9PROT|nr:Grx4 family monothiol glutaredoxin [Mariprofundus ferrinatatus]ATX80998.1 monothiol glutaredoxin [Mariprofundus ferrinatatus]